MFLSLVPYNYDLFDDLDRYFSSLWSGSRGVALRQRGERSEGETAWMPAVDIKEEQDKYVVIADIPGVNPKDVELSFENGVLTMRGHRETTKTDESEGFKRVERVSGSFCREFALPNIVDASGIKASGKDGVLRIEIPKQEKAKPVRIPVEH